MAGRRQRSLVENKSEALLAFVEVWAWARLASVLSADIASGGDYPDPQGLAKVIKDNWDERIAPLAKDLAQWLKKGGKETP